MRKIQMRTRYGFLMLTVAVALAGCDGGASPPTVAAPTAEGDPTPTTETDPTPTAEGDPTPTSAVRDVRTTGHFAPLDVGTYFVDPDGDPSTPLRVEYTVAADGWESWIGAAKFAGFGYVAVSIATVTNLVRHGCRDHAPADPPVGPSVDDLATALADLAPFRVTSPPTDVSIYGHSGKHLELVVPDLPIEVSGDDTSFPRCSEGTLESWISPPAAAGTFFGYFGPGQREEFWILDVDGTRLMIAASWAKDSSKEDLAELRALLDSIKLEP